ncbi:Selenocysteine synthase (Seryl-tRNASer selenium transferase)-like protein [Candidatus Sulfopaludibacter sp. SbA4]|nr:Selenocysteine synthase (Seryl-tRNASer selenium transferase)-like protein [Candidatus Sulfopaludibacter sp. SbA4]
MMAMSLLARRNFFGTVRNAVAAGGILGQFRSLGAAPATTVERGEDYYDKLGVTKIINAAGTYTALTASIMPPSVQAAVARAAEHPVRLGDLQKAAGEYLAGKLKCEAAIVTAGAASGLTLGTAGCVTVANKCGIRDIPNEVSHLKNEVVIQKGHRYGYDQALFCCGVRMVEVETIEEYDKAFSDRTVMAHFYNAAEQGQIGREDWIRVAHAHGVPCFNDAAADVPPISNLWNYTQMGFDLVTFSGGKGIRGPQNAGLLLGRKDLIAAAAASNNPFDGVGRGMKVAKEQIVGMVAAVDWFLSQSDESLEKEFRRRADRIAAHLKDLPSIETEVSIPPVANHVPHLLIRYSRDRLKISARDVMMELRRGTPSIELNPSTGSARGASAGITTGVNTIVVGVWMLQPGEDMIVARRLHEVLAKSAHA